MSIELAFKLLKLLVSCEGVITAIYLSGGGRHGAHYLRSCKKVRPWPNDSIFHSIFYSTKNRGKNRAVWPPC